jgi:glutamyl/glutaminyl-tRNA synthetase
MSFQKTRIAPTPSGYLHLGNIFSFLKTIEIARETNASVLLRIDDIDRERTQPAYLEDIFESLHFLGISFHEGPCDPPDFEKNWSQARRLQLYTSFLEELRKKDLVYACDCSRSMITQHCESGYPGTCRSRKISLDAPDVCWRLKTDTETITVSTYLQDPVRSVLPPEMRDFIVRKKDGMPSYQLASLADDIHFNVDLIVRGEDLWPSTLAQLHLARLLGKDKFLSATFLHHQLVKNKNGQKMSKSAGDDSVQFLRKHGGTPEHIIRAALLH